MNGYHTYLLRIWNEGHGEKSGRLTLENTRTGSRVGFTNWVSLVAFLESQTGLMKGRHVISIAGMEKIK